MTPASKVLYAAPTMSVEDCTMLMLDKKKRMLPVVQDQRMVGVIGISMLSYAFVQSQLGGKKVALRHAGASGIVGVRPPVEVASDSLRLFAGVSERAERSKKSSEDASFIHRRADGALVLGVADGVGSWALRGVDAGAFARSLMAASKKALEANEALTPIEVLSSAWRYTVDQKIPGATTALVSVFHPASGKMEIANVGDSGILVLRPSKKGARGAWEVFYRSSTQLSKFNTPFQFGYSPETADKFQTPADADVTEVSLARGDVIIQATDGLFDNLFDADIIAIVQAHLGTRAVDVPLADVDAAALSNALLEKAVAEAYNKHRDSPFALLAKDNDIMWRFGGRPDDITVLVSLVTQ